MALIRRAARPVPRASGRAASGLLAVGFCWAAVGCDTYAMAGIAVAPSPATPPDSAEHAAFAVATDVSTQLRLEPTDPRGAWDEGWKACFRQSYVALCGKALNREIHFLVVQARAGRKLRPWADSVRLELLSRLRAQFGQARVRECDWRGQPDPRRSGCPPVARPGGG